jgi:hypothetical protein
VSGYLPGGDLALSGGFWVLNVLGTSTDLSTSALAWVHVDVPVWINGVRIRHSGRRTFLTGVLDDHYGSGPVPGQRVTISWDRGRIKATVRTGGNGAFSFPLAGEHVKVVYRH